MLTVYELKRIAEKCEAVHNEYSRLWLSPNHNLEIHLFEYFICKDNYNCTEYKLHEIYRRLAAKYIEADNMSAAAGAFDDSLRWNPIDIDTLFEKAKFYRNMQELEKYKELIEDSYSYCYTRSDMARYYRYLGYYYVEMYQPELAEALYTYSNLYYKSEMADQEIKFLKTVMGKKNQILDLEEIKGVIKKAEIPLFPDEHTLFILSETAKTELDSGNKEYAKYLFLFYSQLTGDKNAESILKS